MLRTALRPRFLGLLALCVLVAIAFGQLGRWQLGVAEDAASREVVERSAAQTPADLVSVLEPHTAFPGELSARPVTATGRYAGQGQVLVPGRVLDGTPGLWVVTPFVVDATGATIAVLRGFVTDPGQAGQPPSGSLTISGGLAPGESPSDEVLPEGQLGSVDLSLLVNTWPGDLYNAFVFLDSEDPEGASALTRVPTPQAPAGLRWRNAAYALQWWIFAGFAFWLWWRMVREATPGSSEGEREVGRAPDVGADEDPPGRLPVEAREDGPRERV